MTDEEKAPRAKEIAEYNAFVLRYAGPRRRLKSEDFEGIAQAIRKLNKLGAWEDEARQAAIAWLERARKLPVLSNSDKLAALELLQETRKADPE